MTIVIRSLGSAINLCLNKNTHSSSSNLPPLIPCTLRRWKSWRSLDIELPPSFNESWMSKVRTFSKLSPAVIFWSFLEAFLNSRRQVFQKDIWPYLLRASISTCSYQFQHSHPARGPWGSISIPASSRPFCRWEIIVPMISKHSWAPFEHLCDPGCSW